MRVQLVYAILPIATAMIVSTPGLQKTSWGQQVNLIWTINRTVTSFNLLNSAGLIINPNITVRHIDPSFIFVAILSVHDADTGNYTLRVYFAGDTSPTIDTTACIFIYYDPTVDIVQTPGTFTVNEGSLVMYSCSGAVSSSSLPAQYRPDPSTLNYSFSISYLGTLLRQPDGSVIGNDTGQVIDRFTLIDNQTLQINPIYGSYDGQSLCCTVCDSIGCSAQTLHIFVSNSRPFLHGAVTPYHRYARWIGTSETFTVEYRADPAISSYSWSFSNVEMGPFNPLPTTWTTTSNSDTYHKQLTVSITSSDQYGFYLLTLTNSVGTSNAKFQVVALGVPPDQPSLVKSFVTSSSVNLQWNSGWDNGRQQYFKVSLNDLKQNITIDQRVIFGDSFSSSSRYCVSNYMYIYPYYGYYYYPDYPVYSSYDSHFNCTYVVNFTSIISPETDYEVLLWAVNEFGSSETVRLEPTTPAKPTLIVNSDSISIFGRTSVINFSVEGGTATQLVVQCYELNNINTASGQFSINASTRQVNMTIPNGSKYRFNLLLYNGGGLVAYQTVLIPGEAAPTGSTNFSKYDTSPTKESASTNLSPSETMTAAIILAVLLGVSVIFGLFELAWILNNQCRTTKNADSLTKLSQVPTVSDKVENDYTEQSYYKSLTDQTGASTVTEGHYEEIQNGQENTSI